jgi:hypothetical protein
MAGKRAAENMSDDLFDEDDDALLYAFLRASCLLDYADDGRLTLTAEQRDRLERIQDAPAESDWEFLFGFDEALDAIMRDEA